MNNKYLDKEVFCIGCKKSIGFGYLVQKRKFCSNLCQAKYKKSLLKNEWLTTGRIPNFTGGKSGNTNSSEYVREHILEEQNERCAICGIEKIWNEKELIFILDHINGNCIDNRRENLRMICPNCDSQTETYKFKNKGNGRRSLGFKTNDSL